MFENKPYSVIQTDQSQFVYTHLNFPSGTFPMTEKNHQNLNACEFNSTVIKLDQKIDYFYPQPAEYMASQDLSRAIVDTFNNLVKKHLDKIYLRQIAKYCQTANLVKSETVWQKWERLLYNFFGLNKDFYFDPTKAQPEILAKFIGQQAMKFQGDPYQQKLMAIIPADVYWILAKSHLFKIKTDKLTDDVLNFVGQLNYFGYEIDVYVNHQTKFSEILLNQLPLQPQELPTPPWIAISELQISHNSETSNIHTPLKYAYRYGISPESSQFKSFLKIKLYPRKCQLIRKIVKLIY